MQNKVPLSEFFKKILEFEKEFIFKIMGDKGLSLYDFAVNCDGKNPDLDVFFDDDYAYPYQIFILAKNAFDGKLDLALESIIKLIKNIDLDSICIAENSPRHARFLKEKNREKIRALRSSWKFSSSYFRENIKKLWNETPNNIFFCNKSFEKLENMSLEFQSIGCLEFSKSISRHLNVLKSKEYRKYKQINIEVAACILAKMNNITITSNYEPVIYPYCDFKKIASKNVKNKIEIAENCNFPFFDSYLILVPSFVGFDKDADIESLKNNVSFLLGEKEEEFYFIGLWD